MLEIPEGGADPFAPDFIAEIGVLFYLMIRNHKKSRERIPWLISPPLVACGVS
jgi:hypothetical protein